MLRNQKYLFHNGYIVVWIIVITRYNWNIIKSGVKHPLLLKSKPQQHMVGKSTCQGPEIEVGCDTVDFQ
jgi:hypothetical protein